LRIPTDICARGIRRAASVAAPYLRVLNRVIDDSSRVL
jgi:hypothetical protein